MEKFVAKEILRAAAVAVLCCAGMSCGKFDKDLRMSAGNGDGERQYRKVSVSVSVPAGDATKLTDYGDERNIDNIQLFVFRADDGVLETYSSSETNTIEFDCTLGDKHIFAIANAPDMSSVTSLSELLQKNSQLGDNSVGSLVMTGTTSVTVSSDSTAEDGIIEVPITVRRLVARVCVRKITNAMSVSAYYTYPLVIRGIYLSNVAGDTPYMTKGSPSLWLNRMGAKTDLPDLLNSGTVTYSIARGASHTEAHYFYCYPNPTRTDTSSDTWSPRPTRLVVEAQLLGRTYYYPVTLPEIVSNHTYDIEELKITRLGSDSPDELVEIGDIGVTITVRPWDKGSSTTVTI